MKPPAPGERSNGVPYSKNQVFVPRELGGTFRTHDGQVYRRTDGVIRRTWPKVRGKKARAADKRLRRLRREHLAHEERMLA